MGLAALSDALAWRLSMPKCAKGFSGVAVVSGDVLLRLEKSNANGRSHELMNDNGNGIMGYLWMDCVEGSTSFWLLQVVVVACHLKLTY